MWRDATGLVKYMSDHFAYIYLNGRILDFEEKPKNPKSNLASMGVYIFNWDKLHDYLIADEKDPNSKNDFGANIIPAMLDAGEKVYAYHFKGYWKDVGTIDSLWEANMDLLASGSELGDLNVFDRSWRIYSRPNSAPPHYVGADASVSHTLISEGCEVYGAVENSVLFTGVTVDAGARVKYSIVMPGAVIAEDAVVEYAIVAEDAVIEKGAHVGADPASVDPEHWGVTVVGSSVTVGAGVVVKPRAMADTDISPGEETTP